MKENMGGTNQVPHSKFNSLVLNPHYCRKRNKIWNISKCKFCLRGNDLSMLLAMPSCSSSIPSCQCRFIIHMIARRTRYHNLTYIERIILIRSKTYLKIYKEGHTIDENILYQLGFKQGFTNKQKIIYLLCIYIHCFLLSTPFSLSMQKFLQEARFKWTAYFTQEGNFFLE